ncbi:MAG: hypothetical protein AVDCRST_MAG13-2666 [uncultured Solirubrobacteraceae bacterium]|uniref:Uncharacterized protein n=1 Tax=uncultured Solirubrobacteraceae bacterium TaxID=1162706 RepID=A0A6J4SYD3_9ACTN|nr:MAG: hypothetical protein AVDCRST_MAG13-2666 [uncultured Solirubrobacteraceae bacterium]
MLHLQGARVRGGGRPELDDEGAAVGAVLTGLRDLRARQARGDARHVDERVPDLLDRRVDGERLLELHLGSSWRRPRAAARRS